MTRFRAWMFDNWRSLCVNCLLAGLLLSGCATRGNSELLEARLRQQEAIIQKYARETSELREELALTQREMDIIRADQVAIGQTVALEETVRSLAQAEGIVFNSLLTAGQNLDEIPGDEAFHAVFYPHDAQGEIVKLSGHLEVEAIDLSRPPDQKTIGQWKFSPEESRKLWHAGFLSSGFQIDKPWQTPPVGEKILLLARLKTTDGRTFETSHTMTIEQPPEGTDTPQTMPLPAAASEIRPAGFEEVAESRVVPEPAKWEFEKENEAKRERPVGNLPDQTQVVPIEIRPASAPSKSEPAKIDPVKNKPVKSEPVKSEPVKSEPVKSESAKSAEVAPLNRQPAPFPPGLQTSDNWTESEIPVQR